jgi:polyisoprenoid-binding protein YceI
MTITAGPDDGSLTLHTGVEGKMARMGHALTLAVEDWTATAAVDGAVLTAVELTARVPSLRVVKGDGGLKPLSDKDRSTILESAQKTLKARTRPEVVFRSDSVTAVEGGYDVTGTLTVAGQSRPVTSRLAVTPTDGGLRVTGEVAVVQTAHGVSPYSTLLGALRVRDRVDVRYDVTVPAP